MSNATAKVNKGFLRIIDEFRRRSSVTLATALQFYTMGMLGRTSTGYLAKFDDTQAMTFAGLVRGDNGDPKVPISTAADGTGDIDYIAPEQGFELLITGVAVTDIGRRVYALFDNQGTTDPSATAFANLIGVIEDVLSTTNNIALVRPTFGLANSPPLQVMAASGAVVPKSSTVIISKTTAAALTLADPASGTADGTDITFLSTTAAAHTIVAPSGFNASGTTATFGAAKGNGLRLIAFGGKWYVQEQVGITLS